MIILEVNGAAIANGYSRCRSSIRCFRQFSLFCCISLQQWLQCTAAVRLLFGPFVLQLGALHTSVARSLLKEAAR